MNKQANKANATPEVNTREHFDAFNARVKAHAQGMAEWGVSPDECTRTARTIVLEALQAEHPESYVNGEDLTFCPAGTVFPRLTVDDLEKHRDARGGEPVFNVKVYKGWSAVDFRELSEELGIEPTDKAPTGRHDDDGEPERLPFGREWIEAAEEHHARSGDGGAFSMAQETAFEDAQDFARELFGSRVKVYGAGRSGGYLYVDGGPKVDDLREQADKAEELEQARAKLAALEADPDADPEDIDDAREECDDLEGDIDGFDDDLRRLSLFAHVAQMHVEDFPRAVAWHHGANGFQPALEADREAQAEAQAEIDREDAILHVYDALSDIMHARESSLLPEHEENAREALAKAEPFMRPRPTDDDTTDDTTDDN